MNAYVRDMAPYCADRIGVARLTKFAFDGGDLRPLWQELQNNATDDAAGAGLKMDMSVIAQLLGDQPAGLAIQRQALQQQRLFRSPCKTPRLRLLALAAEMDIGGNTPIEFLLEGSDIELTTLYVVPGGQHPLPPYDAAIVVAPDSPPKTLDAIERLLDGRPVLNHPAGIRNLDRDRLFRLLASVPGLVIPPTARVSRRELAALAANPAALPPLLADCRFPLIVRPVGSHAGRGLAKLDGAKDIEGYLASQDTDAFFLSPYVDYASPDGLFRKYRLVCVGGKAFACHMAISDQWKIWYLNADMRASAAKRAEEAQFFSSFDTAFAARHAGALREMIGRMALDYFQVDCAETPAGKLLVFEADNTAIVHNMDPSDVFPYKGPQMRKVFDAFAAMIHARAGATPA
jgi:hypothetical protein